MIMTADQKSGRRAELYSLLGDLPPRNRPIAASVVHTQHRDRYTLQTLELDLNGVQTVPAYFAMPDSAGLGPVPAVLFSHSHGGRYELGKNELLLGNTYLQPTPYVDELTSRGWAVLTIDAWLFGERSGVTESAFFKRTLWRGQTVWGLMVYDSLRAMDFLSSLPQVDASRIAAMGMSMGSTMSWWLAALDERLKVCVDLCCLTDFDTIVDSPDLDGHGVFYFVPSLLKHFTTAQINELIAPRPHLSLAGSHDPLTPVDGLRRVDEALRDAYAEAPDNWHLEIYDTGHAETPQMRSDALEFLAEHL
ncbi:MAG: acetylxylan esterase [Propionibacteriaceae bacterium]|nr:acetylxylan esterase [Propionibacteriaceae bacterium]